MRWFKAKRKQAAKLLPENSALILGSLPEFFQQPDVAVPYRPDSDFYYLTGFTEPHGFFILKKGRRGRTARSILCVAEKDPKKELWEGARYGPKEAKKVFLMDETHPIDNLEEILKKHLKGVSSVFYNNIHPPFDRKVRKQKIKIRSAREFLTPLRRIKDKTELAFIKQAVQVSVHAHKNTARALKPGVNERALHGVFLKSLMEKGSRREGYPGIVACGNNAVTLHYTKNDSVCRKGELLLLDAGGEMNHYTADITRVYPVSGRFSKSQRDLYEKLLSLQKALIQEVRPEASFKDLNKKMFEGLTNILLETQILKGSFKDHLKKQTCRAYCPHSLGHLLGMDVHDPGFTRIDKNKKPPLLKPGMVLTIEPGLYIPQTDTKSPPELRGTGLRIEDDIYVTAEGATNLTKSAPKEVEELEALCRS